MTSRWMTDGKWYISHQAKIMDHSFLFHRKKLQRRLIHSRALILSLPLHCEQQPRPQSVSPTAWCQWLVTTWTSKSAKISHRSCVHFCIIAWNTLFIYADKNLWLFGHCHQSRGQKHYTLSSNMAPKINLKMTLGRNIVWKPPIIIFSHAKSHFSMTCNSSKPPFPQ